MTINDALRAIDARRNGVWDDPVLMEIGPLDTEQSDIQEIKTICLKAYGFTVGPRDPRINTNYTGAFMVCEAHEENELPTQDGRNGPWCVVGDDLKTLVNQGFDFIVSLT